MRLHYYVQRTKSQTKFGKVIKIVGIQKIRFNYVGLSMTQLFSRACGRGRITISIVENERVLHFVTPPE